MIGDIAFKYRQYVATMFTVQYLLVWTYWHRCLIDSCLSIQWRNDSQSGIYGRGDSNMVSKQTLIKNPAKDSHIVFFIQSSHMQSNV